MNNEDKILAMLEQLQQGQAELQAGQASMQSDIQDLKSDMTEVKDRVLKIEIVQENRIVPHIQLISEGFGGMVDRLDRLDELPDRVEDIQNTVSVMKYAFKDHAHN